MAGLTFKWLKAQVRYSFVFAYVSFLITLIMKGGLAEMNRRAIGIQLSIYFVILLFHNDIFQLEVRKFTL